MERKLFDERTNLVVKDLSQQDDEKYVAIITALGDKSAIAFDKMIMNPSTIVLLAKSPNPDSIKPEQGPMVAAFPTESEWVCVKRDRFIEMSGKDYAKYQVKEAEKQKELAEENYGKDGAYVAVLPSGRQVMLPFTKEVKEQVEKAKDEKNEPVGIPVGQDGGYL